MIDLASIRVLNATGNPFRLPVTASLDRIGLVPGTMTIASTGTQGWPAVDIDGNGPSQAATLWVLLPFGGAWYAGPAERLRPGQLNGTKPEAQPQYGGLETLIGDGWFGKHDSPLRGYRLTTGQPVGFCLVPGNTRFGDTVPVAGRSDVLVCRWPDALGANPLQEVWREGQADAPPVPLPPVVVQPPTPVPPLPQSDGTLQLQLDNLRELVRRMEGDLRQVEARAESQARQTADQIGTLSDRLTVLDSRVTDQAAQIAALGARLDSALATVRNAGGWLSGLFGRR